MKFGWLLITFNVFFLFNEYIYSSPKKGLCASSVKKKAQKLCGCFLPRESETVNEVAISSIPVERKIASPYIFLFAINDDGKKSFFVFSASLLRSRIKKNGGKDLPLMKELESIEDAAGYVKDLLSRYSRLEGFKNAVFYNLESAIRLVSVSPLQEGGLDDKSPLYSGKPSIEPLFVLVQCSQEVLTKIHSLSFRLKMCCSVVREDDPDFRRQCRFLHFLDRYDEIVSADSFYPLKNCLVASCNKELLMAFLRIQDLWSVSQGLWSIVREFFSFQTSVYFVDTRCSQEEEQGLYLSDVE